MLAPCIYGLHLYALMFVAHRQMKRVRAQQAELIERYQRCTAEADWPLVTTQIPLYNELAVARRVIEAAARMDYPAGRHEVQVLDDSTDETRRIVDETCADLRAAGYNVTVVRRRNRSHYKAGALQHGLSCAQGDFIAVFDADFVPDPGFLRRMVPLLAQAPDACCVQGRWGHLNAGESWLTEALSLGMNGHFAIEQPARAWNGFLLNFNGTGGIWRRATIEAAEVGGWHGDTITEDLDLSYRAQLAGWKVIYRIDEICPAEVPADVNAIKTQQRRWATGSIQTARKLLPRVWGSKLTLIQKLEATLHLTSYSVAVFMVLMAALGQLLLLGTTPEAAAPWLRWTWLVVLAATLAPAAAYAYSSYVLGEGLVSPLRVLKLIVLGMGLAVNNAIAVITGLFLQGGEFVRTPKSGSAGAATASLSDQRKAGPVARRRPAYDALRSRIYVIELSLSAFCALQALWLLLSRGDWGTASFLTLYAVGFFALGWPSRPGSGAAKAASADTASGAASARSTPAAARPAGALRSTAAPALHAAPAVHLRPYRADESVVRVLPAAE